MSTITLYNNIFNKQLNNSQHLYLKPCQTNVLTKATYSHITHIKITRPERCWISFSFPSLKMLPDEARKTVTYILWIEKCKGRQNLAQSWSKVFHIFKAHVRIKMQTLHLCPDQVVKVFPHSWDRLAGFTTWFLQFEEVFLSSNTGSRQK